MLLDGNNLKKITLLNDSTILDVINNLNVSQFKIVLIINKNKKFVGIITDGDIRRAFAKGYNVKSLVKYVVQKKPFFVKTILELNNLNLKELNNFIHIPVIQNNKIKGLYIKNIDLNIIKELNKDHVVIMAGGFGRRLGALTRNCPKALLKYNNKTLLQHILEHLKKNNFYNIFISVFYLKKMIKSFVYRNNLFSLNIKFVEEKSPLGTIGSIRLIKKISANFIVLNCDVISDINLNDLMKFHKKNRSMLTIAIKHYIYKNPYGVVVARNNRFISFREKPEIDFSINSGIYVFNKKVIKIMKKFNLNSLEDLVMTLKKKKYKVFTYQLYENWQDLGSDKKNLKRFIL